MASSNREGMRADLLAALVATAAEESHNPVLPRSAELSYAIGGFVVLLVPVLVIVLALRQRALVRRPADPAIDERSDAPR